MGLQDKLFPPKVEKIKMAICIMLSFNLRDEKYTYSSDTYNKRPPPPPYKPQLLIFVRASELSKLPKISFFFCLHLSQQQGKHRLSIIVCYFLD